MASPPSSFSRPLPPPLAPLPPLALPAPSAGAAPSVATEGAAPAEGAGKARGGKGAKGGGSGREKDEGGEAIPFPKDYIPRLKTKDPTYSAAPMGERGIKNKFAVPRFEKIVVSMGLGKAISEKPRMEAAIKELTQIAGQKAVVCKSKKSVSNFKLREGMEIGAKVTLRGNRMWEFLDRL